MPLFKCSRCGCVDNTALGSYWTDVAEGKPPLCVECETGKWHGCFPKQDADAAGYVPDRGGFLERTAAGTPKLSDETGEKA